MSILQDRRRILGPPDTVKLRYRESESESINLSERNEVSRERLPDQIRKIFLRQGVVSNSNGSVFIEIGDIQLQCTAHGPKPIRGSFTESADFSVEAKISPFSHVGSMSTASLEKNLASFVRTSLMPSVMLSLYPKSAISIVVTVIAGSKGNFKSLLAAATTASSMALVDAGISLRDIVTAGSVYVSRKVNENTELKLLVDPEMDTKEGDVDAVVSYQCALNSCITGIWIDGDSLSHEVTDQIVACTKGVATQVRQLMNGLVIERFKEKEQLVTTIAK